MANTQPTLTSAAIKPPILPASAPAKPQGAPVSQAQLDEGIVAKPLILPDFLNVKPVNPGVSFRWVNYDVGEGHSSIRYDQMKAAGFVNAVAADVVNPPSSLVRDGGTKLIYGDVILMKLDRRTYLGALKHNEENANRLVTRPGFVKKGAKEVGVSLGEISAPPSQVAKLSVFTPSEHETAALTGTTPNEVASQNG